MFQTCNSAKAARKVLEAKGVAHFWDQSLAFSTGKTEQFHFKLGNSGMNDDDKDMQNEDIEEEEDDDIVMKEVF